MASDRLVLTFEDKAPLIVLLRGIDPVILGRLLFAWFGLVVAFPGVELTPCANTPELTVAVKRDTAATTIAPYISSFLLGSFVPSVFDIAIS
jgi:hypothetical protein